MTVIDEIEPELVIAERDGTPLLLADFLDRTPPRGEFRTASRPDSPPHPPVALALRAPQLRVVPVVKADRNPYGGFVFVGRASTCDVILRDVSVSKSHAVFEREESGWILRDNRSHNGTWLGDRRVVPGERARLESGAAIRFGAYPVYFMLAPDLRRILEEMDERA